MAKRKTSKKDHDNSKAIGIGVAVAGIAAAAAAGAYYLSTPEGKKRKKEMKGWMLKAKGEVMDKLEDAKEINKETYEKIVDEVTRGYRKLKKVDAKELGMLALELKEQWDDIKEEAKRDIETAKTAKKRITKRAKKVTGSKKKKASGRSKSKKSEKK